MKIGFWFGAILAFTITIGVLGKVHAQQRPGGLPSFSRIVNAFDANKDGAIEKSELPPLAWAKIAKADTNGDGLITEKEFEVFRKLGAK
jgi:EF hand